MKKFLCILFLVLGFDSFSQVSDFKHIDFSKADSIAAIYQKADLNSLPKLAYRLTSNLSTDVEKFRAIFMWISSNITNDHGMYLKNKRKRKKFKNDSVKLSEWNSSIRKKMFVTLRKEKKTVCTGYAYLLTELCKYANIQSKIIDGFSRTGGTDIDDLSSPNHSWNVVLLNNKWYLCDATWASGIFNPNTGKFEFEFKKGYFLTDPQLFVKNHYPLDQKWTLITKDNPSYKEYLEGPLLYSAAFKYSSLYTSPKKMQNTASKKEKVSFRFNLLDSLDSHKIHLLISGRRTDKMVEPENIILEKDTLSFEYQFPRKGFYDVHVMISGEPIMTYTFHVKK